MYFYSIFSELQNRNAAQRIFWQNYQIIRWLRKFNTAGISYNEVIKKLLILTVKRLLRVNLFNRDKNWKLEIFIWIVFLSVGLYFTYYTFLLIFFLEIILIVSTITKTRPEPLQFWIIYRNLARFGTSQAVSDVVYIRPWYIYI